MVKLRPKAELREVLSKLKVELTLSYQFPKRVYQDYVALHAKGYSDKENTDLLKHYYRLFLKNKDILKLLKAYDVNLKKQKDLRKMKTQFMSQKSTIYEEEGQEDEQEGQNIFEVVPIQIQEFLLNYHFQVLFA